MFLFCLVVFYIQHKGHRKALKMVNFVAKWLNLYPTAVLWFASKYYPGSRNYFTDFCIRANITPLIHATLQKKVFAEKINRTPRLWTCALVDFCSPWSYLNFENIFIKTVFKRGSTLYYNDWDRMEFPLLWPTPADAKIRLGKQVP